MVQPTLHQVVVQAREVQPFLDLLVDQVVEDRDVHLPPEELQIQLP
jgi:hypothetical protein